VRFSKILILYDGFTEHFDALLVWQVLRGKLLEKRQKEEKESFEEEKLKGH
jgi:hypothetical protein